MSKLSSNTFAPALSISEVITSSLGRDGNMTQTPKPDLSEHEEETIPFDQVMKKLIDARPAPKKPPTQKPGK